MSAIRKAAAFLILLLGFNRSLWADPLALPAVETIWPLRKPSIVQLTVSGNDPLGSPVEATTGLGVFISSRGDILTALHVVGPDSAWSTDPDGNPSRKVKVSAFTDAGLKDLGAARAITPIGHYDAAVLSLSGAATPSPLGIGVPAAGSYVIAVPWQKGANIPQPITVQTTATDERRVGEFLTLLAELQPGHSGGPIYDSIGGLTALATNKADNGHVLALPVELIRNDLTYFTRGGLDTPLAFVPLWNRRLAPLGGMNPRFEEALSSSVFPNGVQANVSLVCFSASSAAKPRVDKLSLEVKKLDLSTQAAHVDISGIKALGPTAIDRLQITANGETIVNAFWRDAAAKETHVRSQSLNSNLFDTPTPKAIDFSCKDDEKWSANVDIAERANGLYRMRFVADFFIGTKTYTIYSDPIYVEKVGARQSAK